MVAGRLLDGGGRFKMEGDAKPEQHEFGGGGAAGISIATYLEGYHLLVTGGRDDGNRQLYADNGIDFICDPRMNCSTPEFLDIAANADIIIVNSVVSYYAVDLVQGMPGMVFWWLHNHYESYQMSDLARIRALDYRKDPSAGSIQ